jgi:hypothetical protein
VAEDVEQHPIPVTDERRTLRNLIDKQAIAEVLHRRVRASDRRDVDLALSCYHEGASEEHEGFSGSAAGFITDQSFSSLTSSARVTTLWHSLSNISIELAGEDAVVESYYLGVVVREEGAETMLCQIGGRYLDQFAWRDARWAIAHRTVVYDWSKVAPVGPSYWDMIGRDEATIIRGAFGPSDPLYTVFDVARGATDDGIAAS